MATKSFSTTVVRKTLPRHFVMGKGYATATLAYRALAKKEIAVYAATKAKPAAVHLGALKESDNVKDALGWLFGDYAENDEIWLGEGSEYKAWVHARAEALKKGAEVMITETVETVPVGDGEDYDVPCWQVGWKIGTPWPREDEVLAALKAAGKL